MKQLKKYVLVGVFALMLTVSLGYGLTLITSNHIVGSNLPRLELSSNITGQTFQGDTFHLTASLTNGQSGVLVTFYDNGSPIGTATTISGITSIDYVENNVNYDIYCSASV